MATKYCAADAESRSQLIDLCFTIEDIEDDAEALYDAINNIDGEPRRFIALIKDILELVEKAKGKTRVNGKMIYDHIDSTQVRDREV